MGLLTVGECSYPAYGHQYVSDRTRRTPAYRGAVSGLANIVDSAGIDDAQRAAAEALWAPIFEEYQRTRGLKLKTGTCCLNLLVRRRCPACQGYARYRSEPALPCRPPGADHASMWNEDGRPVLYVYQPYYLYGETLIELAQLCEAHDLTVRISSGGAWHFPGRVLLVEVAKDERYLRHGWL